MVKKQRFEELEKQMNKRAAYAVATACLAPPPFPFTAVIAAASAFQYPRRKLFAIALVARLAPASAHEIEQGDSGHRACGRDRSVAPREGMMAGDQDRQQ